MITCFSDVAILDEMVGGVSAPKLSEHYHLKKLIYLVDGTAGMPLLFYQIFLSLNFLTN